ncbi:hypothetical protein GQX73_g4977 [Xylaria multiplex]|uniref:Uncharacterized protein n=1 Tax=Xylaria multiplex TaxID=323545 RepID=A0A7C8MYC9_9PEZI|nr:hypothetical protein GQX73_g4977 [Xylaria multiplex]
MLFTHSLYFFGTIYRIRALMVLAVELPVVFQTRYSATKGLKRRPGYRCVPCNRRSFSHGNILQLLLLEFSKSQNAGAYGRPTSVAWSNLAAGVFNSTADLEALLLPARIMATLRPRKLVGRKPAAFSVFSVGSVFIFASAVSRAVFTNYA